MGKRSNLSVNERAEAVMALLRREESGAQIARRCGVSEQTLYRWRDQFLEGAKSGLASGAGGSSASGNRKVEELESKVEERDQVIGELTVANRILKKLSGS